MTWRGLLCAPWVRLRRHTPRRVLCAVGFAYECEECGARRLTVGELMSDTGYVSPGTRPQFVRDARYQRSAA